MPSGSGVHPDASIPLAVDAGGLAHPLRREAAHRRRDYLHKRLLLTADLAGIVIALLLAGLLASPAHPLPRLAWALATLPAWVTLIKLYGLYDRDSKRVSHTTVDDLPWLFNTLVVGGLAMWLFLRALGFRLIFLEMLLFGGTALVLMLSLRAVARAAGQSVLAPERVLLACDEMTAPLVRKMRMHPEYGLDPVGLIAPRRAESPVEGLAALGTLDELERIAVEHDIDRIVVSPTSLDTEDQLRVLRQSRDLDLKVSVLPHGFDAMGPSVAVDDVEGVTLFGMTPPVLTPSSRLLKRTLDLAGASAMLLAFALPMLAIAVAIRLESKGPVFFRQSRVGREGHRFRVWKFRSMVPDADRRYEELRRLSKDPNWLHLDHDPRITRVGRFLRNSSLDELPQLFNVLRGEMSLVGPRPLNEADDRLVDGWARQRLQLTPGITGSWQVLGRTNIPFEEMVKLDYLYVMNWSLWNDIRLMLHTLPVVIARRGAN